jgi:hypothetical protein
MNRLFNVSFSATLGMLALSWSQAAYSHQVPLPIYFYGTPIAPIVGVPVTGGQFSVDLNVQNGVVQNYSYTNNQLPTLLTPVGTINLTGATLPILGWQDNRSSEMIKAKLNPIAGINLDNSPKPITASMQVTGSTQLNDGRSATLTNTRALLYGTATASSPFPIESIGTATKLDALLHASVYTGGPISDAGEPTYKALPNTYQGAIQMNIQQGAVMVPQQSFSAAQNSEARLSIVWGEHLLENQDTIIVRGQYDGDIEYLGHRALPSTLVLNSQDQTITASPDSEMKLFSLDGTMSLTINHRVTTLWGSFSGLAPVAGYYFGRHKEGLIWTGVVNGHVTLANAQKVKVQDRLITFYDARTYDNSQREFIWGIVGGDLYVDPNAIVPPPKPIPISPTEPTPISIAALSNSTTPSNPTAPSNLEPQQSILTDTTIANQLRNNTAQLPILRPTSSSQNTIADIAASPLSSSRIFPDMGALR